MSLPTIASPPSPVVIVGPQEGTIGPVVACIIIGIYAVAIVATAVQMFVWWRQDRRRDQERGGRQ